MSGWGMDDPYGFWDEEEEEEEPDPSERIREDTGRLYRLFLMVDGRLKFPILVSRFPK